MKPKIINTFISSANRENNEPIHNFNIDFTDDLIRCNEDQYIRLNVISFDMLNTMYNIKNTSIKITTSTMSFIIPIPDGNYSVYSLKKWYEDDAKGTWYNSLNVAGLTEKATNVVVITKYNISQNTFSFKAISSECYISPCMFLGIKEKLLLPFPAVETTGGYINLVNYNKVIIRTDSLSFDVSCIENIKYTNNSNKLKLSNILFWTSKQDVEPFRNICYNNVDGGNSFNVMIHDKFVNQMNLQLTNELGEFITDASDYLLVLQFSIHDKDEWFKKTILDIEKTIKQIFVMILWIMENYLQIL